jgi:hypothetical protein
VAAPTAPAAAPREPSTSDPHPPRNRGQLLREFKPDG